MMKIAMFARTLTIRRFFTNGSFKRNAIVKQEAMGKERFHCPMLFVPVLASEEHNVSSMHPESTFTRFQLAQWWWG